MHTAPTGRADRQFIDLLKMLGTANAVYALLERPRHHLRYVLTVGGGEGWDDLVAPRQKHALKLSQKIHYEGRLTQDRRLSAFLGHTNPLSQPIKLRSCIFEAQRLEHYDCLHQRGKKCL
jgi:hypothetical protein